MTLTDLVNHWSVVSPKQKLFALKRIYEHFEYSDEYGPWEDSILEKVFNILSQEEDDDFFGTEGLNV